MVFMTSIGALRVTLNFAVDLSAFGGHYTLSMFRDQVRGNRGPGYGRLDDAGRCSGVGPATAGAVARHHPGSAVHRLHRLLCLPLEPLRRRPADRAGV